MAQTMTDDTMNTCSKHQHESFGKVEILNLHSRAVSVSMLCQ